jgi:hypothetical protein
MRRIALIHPSAWKVHSAKSPVEGSRKSVSRALNEAQQSPKEKKMTRVSLSSHRAKPDLAIWAHQARKISDQALEACRRG